MNLDLLLDLIHITNITPSIKFKHTVKMVQKNFKNGSKSFRRMVSIVNKIATHTILKAASLTPHYHKIAIHCLIQKD